MDHSKKFIFQAVSTCKSGRNFKHERQLVSFFILQFLKRQPISLAGTTFSKAWMISDTKRLVMR